jgi:hypothetical protein
VVIDHPGFRAHLLLREGWHDAKQVRPGNQDQGDPAGSEHRDEYETEWAAMKAISTRLGMSAETLRKCQSFTDINTQVDCATAEREPR